MKTMKCCCLLLNFLILLSSLPLHAGVNLEAELACYQALHFRTDAKFNLYQETLFIPILRDGKRSLLIYTKDGAHQLAMPKPVTESKYTKTKVYYFKLNLPAKKPMYVYFQDMAVPEGSLLTVDLIPQGEFKKKVRDSKPMDYYTDHSREVLHEELRSRIKDVHQTYTEAGYDVDLKRAQKFKDDLKVCANIPAVKEDVLKEMAKFPSPINNQKATPTATSPK